jgi:acyl-CoA synthetase (AMP-forming)/AMP-acid ligase II
VLLDDAAPALLLTDPAHRKAAADAVARATHRVPVAPLATPAAAGRLDAAPDPEAAVLLCYTSGSSGRPRGVPLSSRMCLATDDALDGVAQLTSDDVVLQLLPQYHVGGWTVLPLLALASGATLVLEPDLDPARAVRLIGARRVTVTMAVPAMYRAMLAAADAAQLSSLRLAICGVERALLNHPAVTDAAVVGVPDERWGTVGIAFVVAATALEPESVRDWCRHRVAGFKVPARVLVVPGLPRTGIGKVCRDLLREQARGDRR